MGGDVPRKRYGVKDVPVPRHVMGFRMRLRNVMGFRMRLRNVMRFRTRIQNTKNRLFDKFIERSSSYRPSKLLSVDSLKQGCEYVRILLVLPDQDPWKIMDLDFESDIVFYRFNFKLYKYWKNYLKIKYVYSAQDCHRREYLKHCYMFVVVVFN